MISVPCLAVALLCTVFFKGWCQVPEMVIRGLTSFLQSQHLLSEEHLSGGHLVIDGNRFFGTILYNCRGSLATGLGGDYTELARDVECSFSRLKRCEIVPIVILNGSYSMNSGGLASKIQDVHETIDKIANITDYDEATSDGSHVLNRTVYIQVMRRIGVAFAMLYHEAEGSAAALARCLDCPVLSNCSDFYALGVPCVWSDELTNPSTWRPEDTDRRTVKCKVFQPQRFLSKFGVSETMMPMVATLPGSNVLPGELFWPFFERLQQRLRPMERYRQHRRIELLMQWLARQTSLQEALDEVLATVPQGDHGRVQTSVTTFKRSAAAAEQSLEFVQDMSEEVYARCPRSRQGVRSVPAWQPPTLRRTMAGGDAPTGAVHALHCRPKAVGPAVEDPELPAAVLAAAPLLSRLLALIGAPPGPLVLQARNGRDLGRFLVACHWRAPLLEQVLLEGAARCRQVALTVLELQPAALEAVPPLLRLPAAALVVWRRATAPRSRRRDVRAVLLSLLALTPDDAAPDALGLAPAAAAAWRRQLAPLRAPRPDRFRLSVTHLFCELQYVFREVHSLNALLGQPLPELDVHIVLHGPLAVNLGFGTSDDDDARLSLPVEEEVDRVVSAVTDAVEAEVPEHGRTYSATDQPGVAPWRPLFLQAEAVSSLHPDLKAARTLTDVLNKITDANETRMREVLAGLEVTTELGLYTLVHTVFYRGVTEPDEARRCALVAGSLAEVQVGMEYRTGKTVRFLDMLEALCKNGVYQITRVLPKDEEIRYGVGETPDDETKARNVNAVRASCREAERRCVGICRFLGAAFERDVLTDAAILVCIAALQARLGAAQYEGLLLLLPVVGEKLEGMLVAKGESLSTLLEGFRRVTEERELSPRLHYRLLSLVELWNNRRAERQ